MLQLYDDENNQNVEPETQNEIHNYEEIAQNWNEFENTPIPGMMLRSRNTLKFPVWYYQANFTDIIVPQTL